MNGATARESETPASEHAPRARRTRLGRKFLPRPRVLHKLIRLAEYLPTRGNEWTLFTQLDDLFDRMIEDIAGAQERVNLEMYDFRNDAVGRRFAQALSECAERGVQVRVLYDAVGCLGVPYAFFRGMEERGVLVTEYHPIAPWRKRFAIFGRNHRKTLVVDGKVAYTGGVNIGLQYASAEQGGDGWRDTHIRLEGPAAGDLETLFTESWYYKTGELLVYPREREEPHAEGGRREAQVYVIGNRGTLKRPMRRLFLLAFGMARRQIEVTCPYLVPDRKVKRALIHAAGRGVKVRLLLPERSDVRVVDYASRSHFSDFLEAGVEIHLWQPTVLHAKVCLVDDRFSAIGSSNLDSHSLDHNLEAMVACDDPELAADLREHFENDLEYSVRVDPSSWSERSWTRWVLERLARLLSPIL